MRVQTASVALSLVTYVVVVIAVLVLYDDETLPDFLVNLDVFDPLFTAVKVCYIVVLAAAYPLNSHPCCGAALDLLCPGSRPPGAGAAAATCVVILSVALAIFCPNIAVALSLVGGTATASIVYIFPALLFRAATRPGSKALAGGNAPLAPYADVAAIEVHMLGVHRFIAACLVALGCSAWVCSAVGLVVAR